MPRPPWRSKACRCRCSLTAKRVKSSHLYILLNTCCLIVGEGTRLAIMLNALHLQASPMVVGVLGSLFSVLPALTSVASGRWVDRTGAARPMLYSALIVAAGAAIAVAWRELAALFLVSLLVGTFANVFFVTTLQVLARDPAPGARVRNFSVLTTANSLGMFLSPLAVGAGIDRFGFATTFLVLALLGLAPALYIGLGGLRGRTGAAGGRVAVSATEITADAGRGPSAGATARRSTFELLRIPPLRWVYSIAFACSTSILLYLFLIPLYGVQRGLSATWIGALMGSFSLSMAVVRLVAPLLALLVPPWQLILVALGASGLMLLALPFIVNVWILLPMGIVLGASLGLSSPIILSLLSEGAPPDRIGEVLGLRMTMVNAILTGVPLVAGSLGVLIGIAPVFWVISTLLIGSCIVARRQWHARRARPLWRAR
ncbi:MAG: MFS transporter [Betaproteobacteria bacterium]|nr:MFS transporter [Betaproteobacteria bacterium]